MTRTDREQNIKSLSSGTVLCFEWRQLLDGKLANYSRPQYSVRQGIKSAICSVAEDVKWFGGGRPYSIEDNGGTGTV